LAFDDAIKLVYEFYKKHPEETLIIVTGDHECGGLKTAFSGKFSSKHFLDAVNNQKGSGGGFFNIIKNWKNKDINKDEAIKQVCDKFGLKNITPEEKAELIKVLGYTLKYTTIDKRPPEIKKMYGRKNMLVNACRDIIARRCGVTWTSFGHSGAAVATTAIGLCSNEFCGQTDNTDIAKRLRLILLR
jgi:alkaline phosphatase